MLQGTIIDELIAAVARIEEQMQEDRASVIEPGDAMYCVADEVSSETMFAGVA